MSKLFATLTLIPLAMTLSITTASAQYWQDRGDPILYIKDYCAYMKSGAVYCTGLKPIEMRPASTQTGDAN